MTMASLKTTSKKNRMPLYLQIAGLMRKKIEDKEWRFEKKIPTLEDLEVEFKASRITLRASLDMLEGQGIISRTRGLGTFVTKDLTNQRWYKLPTSMDQLIETVSNLRVHLLEIDQDDKTLSPALEFGILADGYRRLKRVHYHEEAPYCLIEIHLAKDIYELDPAGFSSTPIIPKLAKKLGIKICQARQIIRVTVSDADTAAYLGVSAGDPIVDVLRVIQDQLSRIVYYAHIQYPAHLIQVDIDLMSDVVKNKKQNRPFSAA